MGRGIREMFRILLVCLKKSTWFLLQRYSSAMATTVRHLRNHWKKYVFGTLAGTLIARYFTNKFRDNLVIREYCIRAKAHGEQVIGLFERPKKVMVFLNPKANSMQARSQFMKYSAPLLHLSGLDITVVESAYEGQIRTLMAYIDPKTDAFVVAGGDGTLMEVINGVMKRSDAHQTRSIPIGFIPLGKDNRFYQSNQASKDLTTPARRIGEATMDVIRGNHKPVHVLELQPENGRLLYALSSVQWGVFKEAYENRNSFRLFGKLRLFFSHLSTALRKWPTDYHLHFWLPEKSLTSISRSPPSDETGMKLERTPSPFVQYASQQSSQTSVSSSNAVVAHPITSLAEEAEGSPQLWAHRELDVVGFELCFEQVKLGEEDYLKLRVWTAATPKNAFIRQGWAQSTWKSSLQLPCLLFRCPCLILQPCSHEESWLSVDGEPYETMPVSLRVLPNAIRMFTS